MQETRDVGSIPESGRSPGGEHATHATHSRIIAWRIPWAEEPGGLQSMGLRRVGHSWRDPAHRDDLQCCLGFRCAAQWFSICCVFFYTVLVECSWCAMCAGFRCAAEWLGTCCVLVYDTDMRTECTGQCDLSGLSSSRTVIILSPQISWREELRTWSQTLISARAPLSSPWADPLLWASGAPGCWAPPMGAGSRRANSGTHQSLYLPPLQHHTSYSDDLQGSGQKYLPSVLSCFSSSVHPPLRLQPAPGSTDTPFSACAVWPPFVFNSLLHTVCAFVLTWAVI